MKRGLPFRRHGFVIAFFLIFITTVETSGCAGAAPSSPEQVVCTPNPSNVNVYRTTPDPLANLIFQYAATPVVLPTLTANVTGMPAIDALPTITSDPQLLAARYAALHYLMDTTKRWSDTEVVKLDDSNEAHITVTFIGPELLQAVILNQILKHNLVHIDFGSQIQEMLNYVGTRDELLFLLTITMTNNSGIGLPSHTMDIPVKEMLLTNGEDLPIKPRHDDHILDQPIKTSSGPVYGYFAYPLAVLGSNKCHWILEPKYNTSIVITLRAIQIDGVENGPYTWAIPYSSVIYMDEVPNYPELGMPPGFDETLLSPLDTPPNEIEKSNNWQDFARFVWHQVTFGNY